jgi:PAT family beta-lactamase induction signal transducer AmpG
MKKSNFWIYIIVASIYFTQGFEGLPNLSVFFFLKENLHLNESQIMFWSSLITLPWLIKIFWGHIIDNYLSKKIWILFSLVGSLLFAGTLGLLQSLPLLLLIIIMMGASFTTAIRDVSTDGLACVSGKETTSTGRFQAISWGFLTLAGLLTGLFGGYIAEHWNYQVAYLLLLPMYLIIIGITLHYKPQNFTKSSINLLKTFKQLFSDKRLLLVCLFLFLYKFSPAFGTPLTFIMKDDFHFSKQFLGLLDSISAGFGILGAWLYWHYSKKINRKKWLIISVFTGAILTLCYLYFTPVSAIIYTILFGLNTYGIITMFIALLILDWMAQNTKSGLESTSFALLCSVSNLSNTANGFIGSWLFSIIGLKWLIIISAFTSFLCLPLIPYLKLKE